jgi:hypothetical protein
MNDKLVKLLTSEPVRVWLYGILVPLVGLLVAAGIVSGGLAPFIVAVAVAILGGVSTEVARGAVSPVQPPK